MPGGGYMTNGTLYRGMLADPGRPDLRALGQLGRRELDPGALASHPSPLTPSADPAHRAEENQRGSTRPYEWPFESGRALAQVAPAEDLFRGLSTPLVVQH